VVVSVRSGCALPVATSSLFPRTRFLGINSEMASSSEILSTRLIKIKFFFMPPLFPSLIAAANMLSGAPVVNITNAVT